MKVGNIMEQAVARRRVGICLAVLLVAVLALVLVPAEPAHAAYTAKKSITITVKSDSYKSLKFSVKNSTAKTVKKYKFKIEVLSVTGKAKHKTEECVWGFGTQMEKGSLFYKLKTKKLKKGNTLTSQGYVTSSGGVTFETPCGVKKMKLKVTIYAVNGKKSVKSLKSTSNYY